jgi:hypothetical protein
LPVGAHNDTLNEFADVWKDSAKMELAISHLLHLGVENILKGYSKDHSRDFAMYARYFEQYIAVELHQTQATMNCPKIGEMTLRDDEHTLVKFFRTRIPCSCLDEKYHEVKHITKMGFCYNPKCNIPARQIERSKTMYCSRCRSVTYCSQGCQKANWKEHKKFCDHRVAKKAEFEAQHQKT